MEILTNFQKKFLDLFRESSLKEKFYWTGGTALSVLYLKHRFSYDLDFFSDKPFNYEELLSFIKNVKDKLGLPYVEAIKIFDRREFILHNKEKLRIEFAYYPYKQIKKRKLWKGIYVDSLDDIAANKFMSLFDRNDPKDLFDLYFLLTKKKYTLEKLIKLTHKKFGVKINKSTILGEIYKAVKNLEDLKPFIIAKNPKNKEKIINKIKKYFDKEANLFLKKFLL